MQEIRITPHVLPNDHPIRRKVAMALFCALSIAPSIVSRIAKLLRQSFASTGLARGDALPMIGAILGHADVKTTSRYAHLADDPIRQAADGIAQSIAGALLGHTGAFRPHRCRSDPNPENR